MFDCHHHPGALMFLGGRLPGLPVTVAVDDSFGDWEGLQLRL